MRTLLLSASALALGATGAFAEGHGDKCFDKGTLSYVDCPAEAEEVVMEPLPEPAPTFTGLYVGFHIGAAGADFEGAFDFDDGIPDGAEVVLDDDDVSYAIGAQIGALYQFENNFVIGAEIDASFTDLEVDAAATDNSDKMSGEIDWFGSARVKAGYAFDRIMPFVTAGVGLVSYEFQIDDDGDSPNGVVDEVATAAVFGGGVEYLISDYATIRLEGLYYAMDEREGTPNAQSGSEPEDFVEVDDLWTVRVGLGFSF